MSISKCCRIGGLIGLVMLLLSCDVTGGLFSQSELADMYEVWIDIDGLTLGDGDIVRPDSSLIPVIESPGSVRDPGKLTLVLVDMNGAEAARLSFMAEAGAVLNTEDTSLRRVRSLKGALPSFSLPEDLAEGYYFLETRLDDLSGRTLSNASTLVLVYNGVLVAPRIETFPSSPAKGQPVFLRLVHSLPDGLDPWLRWYVGGGLRKEGYASDFADRLVWQIPESDGFFSVRAELFPFKPPVGILNRSGPILKPGLSALRADLILAIGPARSTASFDGMERIYSVDFKSEPETQKVIAPDGTTLSALMVGSPYLEPHGSGYGHALKAGAGYLIPGSILPRNGKPFSLVIALDPAGAQDGSGDIVTLYEAGSSSLLMRLGVSDGLPYLEAGSSLVQGFGRLPAGLSHLVLEVVPVGPDTPEARVSFFLNSELVGSGVISGRLLRFAGPVTTLIGGPEGLEAVYDELAVLDGKFQGFLAAKAHEFGSGLVAASGFEGGAIGRGISILGPAQVGDGFLELPLDARLEVPLPAGSFIVEIEGDWAALELVLVMDDTSPLVLFRGTTFPGVNPGHNFDAMAAAGSGLTKPASGEGEGTSSTGSSLPVGWLTPSDRSISLTVEHISEGLRISDHEGRNLRVSTALSTVALRVQPARFTPLMIQTIMVRTFSPVVSFEQADSNRAFIDRTASLPMTPPLEAAN